MQQSHDSELDALLQECDALISGRPSSQDPANMPDESAPQMPLQEQEPAVPSEPDTPVRPTTAGRKASGRNKRGCRGCLVRLLVILLLLAVLTAGALYWFFGRSRDADSPVALVTSPAETSRNVIPETYTRREGVSTILLAGTDEDGLRTDTILLLYVDSAGGKLNLLSIPRDTLVWGGYSVPKINSAYGWAGGGEAGMEELLDRVHELLGYRPDAYCTISLDTLIEAVDLMGGVEFDVPMDMVYSDPWQNLEIDLNAGMQTLNGQQAMGLLRFRSGYAMADLQRVEVQRDFLKAAARQWAAPANAIKLPQVMKLIQEQALTDLDTGNLLWLASAVLNGDLADAETATLPGTGVNWSSGSYYVADPSGVLELLNERYNIYDQDLDPGLLNIRTQ